MFRKLACELAEVTLRLTSNLVGLHSAGNLTVVEGRFRDNCLLYGLEIFVAAAVMKGITCVVQCYNNKSNHQAGISLHQSLASGPAMEKWIMFVLTPVQISTREVFLTAVPITSRPSVSRGLLMSTDPRGRLFHCPFQLYGKKDPEKNETKGT